MVENKPYGCWIDKRGNMTIVNDEDGHAEVALEKILKNIPRKYSIYEIMLRLGFVRVVFLKDGTHTAEYNRKYGNTRKQSDWINQAVIVDAW